MILGLFGRERLVACARVRGGEELRGNDMKGAFSANPRQEHEYHVFEQFRPPDGKILIPGVISHTTNLVEHPEPIAERIVRFAKIVGRENVIAGADCGFAASAVRFNDTHPSVAWLQFAAMTESARLATRQLWGRA